MKRKWLKRGEIYDEKSIYLANSRQFVDMNFAKLMQGIGDLVVRQPTAYFGDSFDNPNSRVGRDGQSNQSAYYLEQNVEMRRDVIATYAG